MTERLREELLRVGENVAPLHVPGDLWARGRRVRRRDRLVSGGVVLSVVGLIFAISMMGIPGLGGRADVAPVSPSDEEGAVPSMLYGVPERLTSHYEAGTAWSSEVAEADLAIGRASVAFPSGGHQPLPVVVTAADGRYHLLRLPGWAGASLIGSQLGGVPLALAPDGQHLAYGWYDPTSFGAEAVRAGIRIVDLQTGHLRTISLSGGRGVGVGSINWSPDGRWILWQGQQMKVWEMNRTSWQRDVAGRFASDATTSEPIRTTRGRGELLAIDNDGAVSWLLDGAWNTRDRSGLVTTTFDLLDDDLGSASSASPSGRVVALAAGRPMQQVTFVRSTASGGRQSHDVLSRDLGDLHPEGATVEPVGWLDEDHVAAVVTAADGVSDGGWTHGARALVVMSVNDESTYEAITDIAGGTEFKGQIAQVSVAVDLLDPLKPVTRDFPEPQWPMSDERKAVYIGLSVAAGLGCLLLARRTLRRRRGVLR